MKRLSASAVAFALTLCGLLVSCCGPAETTRDGPTTGGAAGLAAGSYVVDLRLPDKFAKGHPPGAVNLQWGYGQFEIRVARVFPAGSRLQIVGDDVDQVSAAVALAKSAGFEAEAVPLSAFELQSPRTTMTLEQLRKGLSDRSLTLLDARTAQEYSEGHIAGAIFLYPDDVATVQPALAADREIAVICEAGWRSSLVTSYLRQAGFAKVYNVIEGMKGWQAAGLPVETGEDQRAWK